jgi:tetratricopeptide (TPR) repeat protein
MTDDQFVERYETWAQRLQTEPSFAATAAFEAARADLQRITNEADDVHLRANAALLLGVLHEARGERDKAIDFYRHATKLTLSAPGERTVDDAGPFMALAVALAAHKKYPEAIEAQTQATTLDPDNLENWLALAELFIKAGDEDSATKAYVDYEVRRKGLIDGLTLKKGDAYRADAPGRIGCAEALASAADGGTGVALLYALKTDPEASVREAVARAMGIQRLSMYKKPLTAFVGEEKDDKVLEAAKWALAEIARDPVEAKPVVPAPEDGVKPSEPDG